MHRDSNLGSKRIQIRKSNTDLTINFSEIESELELQLKETIREDNDDHKQIIIVRRRSNGDEGHHGGVWKIAFADFMTAMMAFFLVLWIVNSTSKETQASIADTLIRSRYRIQHQHRAECKSKGD